MASFLHPLKPISLHFASFADASSRNTSNDNSCYQSNQHEAILVGEVNEWGEVRWSGGEYETVVFDLLLL